METLEEIRAEVARIYRDYLPDRLTGTGQDEQAYFTTGRANNGGTEANGNIELHRHIERGFRNPPTTDFA